MLCVSSVYAPPTYVTYCLYHPISLYSVPHYEFQLCAAHDSTPLLVSLSVRSRAGSSAGRGMRALEQLKSSFTTLTHWLDLRTEYDKEAPKFDQSHLADSLRAGIKHAEAFIAHLKASITVHMLTVPPALIILAWQRWATVITTHNAWDRWAQVLLPSATDVWAGLPVDVLRSPIQLHVKDTLISIMQSADRLNDLRCAMRAVRPHLDTLFESPTPDGVPPLKDLHDAASVILITEVKAEDIGATQDLLIRMARVDAPDQSKFMKALRAATFYDLCASLCLVRSL